MQLANSTRLIKGIQLLLNDLIWQIATLGEGALLHTMVLSQQCIHCVHKAPPQQRLCWALAELSQGQLLAQGPWITPALPTLTSHHCCNSLPSDSFPGCFWFIPKYNTGAKLNCSDLQKTGWKVKQPEFTKSKFHNSTDCGLILVLAPFCRKAGRERSCYSETSL